MIGFGDGLKRFREERGLSLRELATLSRVDHAYIYRLETGDKDAPSEKVLAALCNALKLSARRRQLLQTLLAGERVPDGLFEAMLQDPGRSVEAFKIALATSFRGAKPGSADEWGHHLDWLDKEVLRKRDG